MNEPLPPFQQSVRPEWIDYNGHMSEAFYVLVFGYATDAMMDAVGLNPSYREETGCSLYTVEAHVRYLREVTEGAPLTVRTRVLGVDAKKLRFAHEMYAGAPRTNGTEGGGTDGASTHGGAIDGRALHGSGTDGGGNDGDGTELVATSELFALHVGAEGSTPFPGEVRGRLAGLVEEPPGWAGRAIGPVPRG